MSSKEFISNLQDKEYCNTEFSVSYAILVKSDSKYEEIHYYKDPLIIDGIEYMLTSQWNEKSKKKLIAWIMDHAK